MRNLSATGLSALALLALVGCAGSDYQLSAQDQLVLSAISGQEDPVTVGAFDTAGAPGAADGLQPGAVDRECDAEGTHAALFGTYDADADAELDPRECDAVDRDHEGQPQQTREDLMRVLMLVYDTDGDGLLSDAERDALLADFTARCEALQDGLLAEHDTDEDGELDEAEREGACDEQREEHDAMEGELEDRCGPPPADTGTRPEGPPPSCFVDSLIAEFDADGDGTLSDAEHATLRETVRARILAGQRFHGDPA